MNRVSLIVFGLFLSGTFMVSCTQKAENEVVKTTPEVMASKDDVFAGVNLTVSEGKRLIAKGIMAMPSVKEKLEKGMIIVTKGTTNTYIAEELLNKSIEHGSFVIGHFAPEGQSPVNADKRQMQEVVIKDGKVLDVTYDEALKMLEPGDIVMKGGNLLNYSMKQAAVCIGAPNGGTTYKLLPYVGEGKAELIIPIGLEKETTANLEVLENTLNAGNERLNSVPRLYMFRTGTVFTEIEAIRQFADVKVFPYGVGGISGREGGVSLVISGSETEVNKVLELVKAIQGERPF
ncbi:hypothetical protein [uncultured Bacteroides sp.]|uniref:hypothetical protein n=1 Tax=uncultured Bacteroides sp. TaxID=162156 RepID=UPI002591479E|nr:hypothetical protein [uncultured Bacteroides sp.]